MTDTVAAADVAAPVAVSSPAAKKTKALATKKPRVKPAHPPTSEMVDSAIKSLKERGGSSLQAIKKYVTSNYKIEAEKLAPFIKRYLRTAVAGGKLIQTKGKGASGSFKLAVKEKTAAKPVAVKKVKTTKIATKSVAAERKPKAKKSAVAATKKKATTAAAAKKKSTDAKKTAEKKKVAVSAAKSAKSTKASVKSATKSPKQKPTKATKTVAKKPKTPKPKKATAVKKATAPKKPTTPKKK